jgi:hypothetical protein
MYLATAAVLRQRFRCATYFGKRLALKLAWVAQKLVVRQMNTFHDEDE